MGRTHAVDRIISLRLAKHASASTPPISTLSKGMEPEPNGPRAADDADEENTGEEGEKEGVRNGKKVFETEHLPGAPPKRGRRRLEPPPLPAFKAQTPFLPKPPSVFYKPPFKAQTTVHYCALSKGKQDILNGPRAGDAEGENTENGERDEEGVRNEIKQQPVAAPKRVKVLSHCEAVSNDANSNVNMRRLNVSCPGVCDIGLEGERAPVIEHVRPSGENEESEGHTSAKPEDSFLEREKTPETASFLEGATSSQRIFSKAKTKSTSSKSKSKHLRKVLRKAKMPRIPEENDSQLIIHSLSAPRPKSVRISHVKPEERIYEPQPYSNDVKLINFEKRRFSKFPALEGRWGLCFPEPGQTGHEGPSADTESESVSEGLFWHSRVNTPKRLGFAGDHVGEMAYYTGQSLTRLRPKKNDNTLKRDSLFTPAEGRMLRGGDEVGFVGPPSRHIKTRAGQVVEAAKERAMELKSPRCALCVCNSAGQPQCIPGVTLSPVDSTPLSSCNPYPVFYNAANEGMPHVKKNGTVWTLPRWLAEETEEADSQVRQIMMNDLIRKGLLPKPSTVGDPRPSFLYLSLNEIKQKHEEHERKTFERSVKEATEIKSRVKWGPHSKTHELIEMIRASPDRRQGLEAFVKCELPKLKKVEREGYYKVNMIEQNRQRVCVMSQAKEREREAHYRSQSVPLLSENEHQRLLKQNRYFEESERRRLNLVCIEEHKRRMKQATEEQAARERALHENEIYQRSERVRKKSTTIRNREYSQPFLTALLVACFAIRINPKARKLLRKLNPKTNMSKDKYAIRIQRWFRLVLQIFKGPQHGHETVKETLEHADHEQKVVARARHMIHMWQKAKHVAAIAYFLRKLVYLDQTALKKVQAKYAAVRVIQKCVRAFIMGRKTTWVVWEMQWIRFERARNRELAKKWKDAWHSTMNEISKLCKVVPGKKKGKQAASTRRLSMAVMDSFINDLPEEVKNIMDVPAEIRRYVLACHKIRKLRTLTLLLDERKRIVYQMRQNRKLRDELCEAFPSLGHMDLQSPELSFLKDVDNEPPHPHFALVLKEDDLADMLLHAQMIARGREPRPLSPPEDTVLKAIPRHVDHEMIGGVSLQDPNFTGSRSGPPENTLGKYLGANSGMSR